MEGKEKKKEKINYSINERVFETIDKLTDSSKEISETSANLVSQLTSLFESIEDETCEEILLDIGKINDFISYVANISKNELQEIKTKSKLAIEKADKRKDKILYLKEENGESKIDEKKVESFADKIGLNITNAYNTFVNDTVKRHNEIKFFIRTRILKIIFKIWS